MDVKAPGGDLVGLLVDLMVCAKPDGATRFRGAARQPIDWSDLSRAAAGELARAFADELPLACAGALLACRHPHR